MISWRFVVIDYVLWSLCHLSLGVEAVADVGKSRQVGKLMRSDTLAANAETNALSDDELKLSLPHGMDLASPYDDVPTAWLPQLQKLHADLVVRDELPSQLDKLTRDVSLLWRVEQESGQQAGGSLMLTDAEAAEVEEQLTNWHCMEAHGSQWHRSPQGQQKTRTTCKIKNLYFEARDDGGTQAVVHTLKDSNLTLPYMSAGASPNFNDCSYNIRHQQHSSLKDFAEVLKSSGKLHSHKGNTLVFWPAYHFNIGHGLFDSFYPAFVSLLQHGEHDKPFRPFLLGGRLDEVQKGCPACYDHVEEVFGKIGRIPTMSVQEMASSKGLHRFEEAVLGIGANSAKIDMNMNYSLGACRELDACRAFRQRVFASVELPQPAPVKQKGPYRVKVIYNSRFQGHWEGLVSFLQNESKHRLQDFEFEGVQWTPEKIKPNTTGVNRKMIQTGDFKKHMQIIGNTDVHISSPGTAMMYQTFLPDGAVHVNMGDVPIVSFMEEYMAEGSPYLHALYYPRRTEKDDNRLYDGDKMVKILLKAKSILSAGLHGPVPVNNNLSPLGKVFKAFGYWLHEQDPANGGRESLQKHPPMQREVQGADWLGNDFPSTHRLDQMMQAGPLTAWSSVLADDGKYANVLRALMAAYDGAHPDEPFFNEQLSRRAPVMAAYSILSSDVSEYASLSGIV